MPRSAPPAGANDKPANCYLKKGRYWYWEPPRGTANGRKGVSLGADQAKAWAMARELNRSLLTGPGIGSIQWLYEQYKTHRFYLKNRPSTRADYDYRFGQFCRLEAGPRLLGEHQAAALTALHVDGPDGIYERLIRKHGPATAAYICRIARRVWNVGIRFHHVSVNPWAGMGISGSKARDQKWEPEEVAAVCAKARDLGKPSIEVATALAYWFGWRPYDVLDLTWAEVEARKRDTSKTGVAVPVLPDAYPDLAAVLARAPRFEGVEHVVVSERLRRRWSRSGFAHAFREVADAAGIRKELQFRDLRTTAQTELDEGGVDGVLASTHTAHKTVQMRRRYSRRTEEAMREAARRRLEALERRGA